MSTDELLMWLKSSGRREHEAGFAKGRRTVKQQRAEVTAELEKHGVFGELSRLLADQVGDVDGHAPGAKVAIATAGDYRGRSLELRLQKTSHLVKRAGDRSVISPRPALPVRRVYPACVPTSPIKVDEQHTPPAPSSSADLS